MTDSRLSMAIAAAVRTEDPEILRRLAEALASGELTRASTPSAIQTRAAAPTPRLEPLRRILDLSAHGREGASMTGAMLSAALETAKALRADAPQVYVAATQPNSRLRVRSTGGVAREIVEGSERTLLVVGYRVTTDATLAGLASRTLKSIGAAAMRGVAITAVLHHEERNRSALLRTWPAAAPPPRILTWPIPSEDQMAKMHAKVLVADRADALVTSANLTLHGFSGSVELGVRIVGSPAADVEDVFDGLIRGGELIPWPT